MKVIAFNGSPRKDGNTAHLLGHVCSVLQQRGIDTEIVQVGGLPIQGCTACMTCRENRDLRCVIDDDIVNSCIEKMVEADGIIFGSPTYFADVTPEIKALIDRAGFAGRGTGNVYARKLGAAVIAMRRSGGMHAFDTINHFFGISQMITVGSSYWNIGLGGDPGEVEDDEEGVHTMQTLGETMAWLLRCIEAGPAPE